MDMKLNVGRDVNTNHRRMVARSVLSLAAMLSVTSAAHADTWRGTAPFCNGKCEPGEKEIAKNKTGDGGSCWSGHKVLCQNTEETCFPREVTAECDLVVLVCDNGCSSYACGACTGEIDW